ncbi:hypothetical protein ACFQI7_31615 [Paenibacillus allorhizosphaerae]|uniref:Uncharacterized protein n=1 Tax=Paenibacillus allorhizosphaerae TaxID=2849866 RepID=A0ABM8VPY2_9BACL|nr:hypothetical protein [Paenibacillus allorhizosphaerae]CAG7653529.1 hypothetical protein PAECIP111802_05510 [Paenibacillus allorhizosphaerae]
MFPKGQRHKIGVLLYLLIWFVSCFWLFGLVYSGVLQSWGGIKLEPVKDYVFYAIAGAIGGTLYAMRLLHEYYDDPMTERWLMWYLLRPIKCGGAAVIMIILFQSGILLLQTNDSMGAKIGIAFLVGFGYGKVLDKLRSLTETLFNGNGKYGCSGTPKEKDDSAR